MTSFSEYEKTTIEQLHYTRGGEKGLNYVTLTLGYTLGFIMLYIRTALEKSDRKMDSLTRKKLLWEIGYMLRFLTALCNELGTSLEEVAVMDLRKQ